MSVRHVLFALFAALIAVSAGSAVADDKKRKEQPKQATKAPASKDGLMKSAPSK
jgi:hypothetical protein